LSYKDLRLRKTVEGSGKLLNNVIKPSLKENTKTFRALTAYYSIGSLEAIGKTLDYFLSNDGIIQIVIGDQVDDERTLKGASEELQKEEILIFQKKLQEDVELVRNENSRFTIATIAYLILDEKLQLKVANYRNGELWHPKMYLLEDGDGNKIAASGSGNMSESGFEKNYEIHDIFTNWDFGTEYFSSEDPSEPTKEEIFWRIWNNNDENTEVKELDKEYAQKLLERIGNPSKEDVIKYVDQKVKDNQNENLLNFKKDLQTSPIFHEFNLGKSALYPHQINAVQKALKMWPIRILFSDEVGLGKTLELGTLIAYLIKNNLVDNVLVLAPPTLTEQWQDEMKQHFDLDFARYDRTKKSWVYKDEEFEGIKENSPLRYNDNFPSLAIMSKSMAVRSNEQHIFLENDSYPDFLVIDEAHHARMHRGYDGSAKKTNFRRVVEQISNEIKHIAFATATPMRKNIDEYFFLLDLLGVEELISEKDYEKSLSIINDFYTDRNNKFNLDDLSLIKDLLIKVIDKSEERFFHNSPEIYSLVDELKNGEVDNTWLFENSKKLIEFHTIYHPTRILTSRNVQENLNKFSEIYKIPKRTLRPSPILPIDISNELNDFFSSIMEYVDRFYQITELAITPDKQLPLGLRRHSLQERFASSFWSAKKSITNRREHLINSLEGFKENKITKEFFENSDENDDEDTIIAGLTKSELVSVDWENVIKNCESEIRALNTYVDLAEIVINSTPEGIDPDPKINETVRLFSEHIDKNPGKPLLIFSKYTDTLNEVERAVISYCETNDIYMGYASYRGDYRRIKYANDREHRKAEKRDITRALNNGRIQVIFCSSAASEGLNLQAASYMINVDVPWVPSDLEQRIGRIARLGQKEDEVLIDNIWYPFSIESNMYKRLIDRQRDMSFAIGQFPDLIAEAIKNFVDDKDAKKIEKTIDEINKKKNTYEMKVLNELWIQDGNEPLHPWGNVFRKEILEIMQKLDLNTESIDSNSGSLDILHFHLTEFEEIFNQEPKEDGSNADLLGIYSNEYLVGFKLLKDGEENGLLINPINFPQVLESLFFGSSLSIETYDKQLDTLNKLLNFYLDIKYPSLLPVHHLISFIENEISQESFDRELKDKVIGRVTL
jgi:SNF2 family DNA or RNA helicase